VDMVDARKRENDSKDHVRSLDAVQVLQFQRAGFLVHRDACVEVIEGQNGHAVQHVQPERAEFVVHSLVEARKREDDSKNHARSAVQVLQLHRDACVVVVEGASHARTIGDAVHQRAEFVVPQGLVETRKREDDSKTHARSVADAVHQMVHVQPERAKFVVHHQQKSRPEIRC